MRRNIEIKARVPSLAPLHAIARQLDARYEGVLEQVDTYFCCSHGRLKLRETRGQPAQLVSYQRADTPDAKPSSYYLVTVDDAGTLREALQAALGIRVVVAKRRELYLSGNVRIHLDEVRELGTFFELEAVLDESMTDEFGWEQVDRLTRAFAIADADRLAGSYADLLEAARATAS